MEQRFEPGLAGINPYLSGQDLENLMCGLLKVQALSGMDRLAEEDMKTLCRLDDGTDLSGGQLKKGMIECAAELSAADQA